MEKKVKLSGEKIDRIADYASTFSTDSGRRVLEDMENSFGGISYVRGDPYETAFREGRRDVLLRIKRIIELATYEVEIVEKEEQETEFDVFKE